MTRFPAWLLTALLFFLPMKYASADNIIAGADAWCPYNCNPKSDRPGYMVEIAKTIFKKAGHTFEYRVMPWTRAIEEARIGCISCIIGATKKEVSDFVFPEHTLGNSSMIFIVNKGSKWRFKGIESLQDIQIGVIADYSYGDTLDDHILKNNKNPAKVRISFGNDAFSQNIKYLKMGRITAMAVDHEVLSYYEYQNESDLEFQHAGEIKALRVSIAFSPISLKSKEYAAILSAGIMKLRKSGALKTILDHYGIHDWVNNQ